VCFFCRSPFSVQNSHSSRGGFFIWPSRRGIIRWVFPAYPHISFYFLLFPYLPEIFLPLHFSHHENAYTRCASFYCFDYPNPLVRPPSGTFPRVFSDCFPREDISSSGFSQKTTLFGIPLYFHSGVESILNHLRLDALPVPALVDPSFYLDLF